MCLEILYCCSALWSPWRREESADMRRLLAVDWQQRDEVDVRRSLSRSCLNLYPVTASARHDLGLPMCRLP